MEQETCESYVLSELKKVKDECQGLQKENEELRKKLNSPKPEEKTSEPIRPIEQIFHLDVTSACYYEKIPKEKRTKEILDKAMCDDDFLINTFAKTEFKKIRILWQ